MLLSSHILAEVEALCDRVSIIRGGRTVQAGTLDDLRQLTRTTVIARDLPPGHRARRPARRRHARAPGRPGPLRRRPRAPRRRRGACSARPASSRWSATRPRSRSSSCGSTATASSASPRRGRDPLRRHRHPGPADPAPRPPPAAGVVAGARSGWSASRRSASRASTTPRRRRATYAATVGTSGASIAMSGPPVALDTIGGITVFEVATTAVIGVALMAVFLTLRHTRTDEEAGRTELLRAGVMGRQADLLATGLVVGLASVAVGAGIGDHVPRRGSADLRFAAVRRVRRGGRPRLHRRRPGRGPGDPARPRRRGHRPARSSGSRSSLRADRRRRRATA